MTEQNCPNCGAPTDGLRCEYCGTQHECMNSIPLNQKVKMSIDVGDAVYEFEMVMHQFRLEPRYNTASYCNVGMNGQEMLMGMEIDASIEGVVTSDRCTVRQKPGKKCK